VKYLTEGAAQQAYSSHTDWLFEWIQFGLRMSRKTNETDVTAVKLKNESARQRWELFHRAVAHAKQSNLKAMEDGDAAAADAAAHSPLLSIVR
jgi:hypothetical protein